MKILALSLFVPFLLAPACVFYGTPSEPYGDISFDWSFDGISRCEDAGVDEIDIVVLSGAEVVAEVQGEPCLGGGLTITEILEGRYEVIVDAYDRDSVLLYSGSFSIRVVGGEDNYAGVVDLEPFDGRRVAATGEVALRWSFLYPSDQPVLDCRFAGVLEVDVLITARTGGVVFEDTYLCDDEGVFVGPLPSGRYDIEVLGYGVDEGEFVLLYDSNVLTVSVGGGALVDLGEVALARFDENFADFDVAWAFVGKSCASAGVDDVLIAVTRDDFSSPEYEQIFDCRTPSVVLPSFVPGDYVVSAFAEGAGGTYVDAVAVDLRRGTVAQLDLFLAP